MYVLGINAYHADASACILKNENLIAAAEEERFGRVKHQAGFPIKAIEFCLNFFCSFGEFLFNNNIFFANAIII